MKIDIVCPLYKPGKDLDFLLAEIEKQVGVEIKNVVLPLTKSENDNVALEKINKKNFKYFLVDKKDFSHSLTRAKAIKEFCTSDIVIMLSQDVRLLNADSLEKLAKAIDEEVVYAYGRQVCFGKGIEDYTRLKNYPEQSSIATKADVKPLGLLTFFASDAFAAYHRPTFLKLNGYDDKHMMMSEDMYYAHKIIMAGYKKAYVAEAVVGHGHSFTLRELYTRYKETGKWFKENPHIAKYKATSAGAGMAKFILQSAVKKGDIKTVLQFVPNMAARWIGMQMGKRV